MYSDVLKFTEVKTIIDIFFNIKIALKFKILYELYTNDINNNK